MGEIDEGAADEEVLEGDRTSFSCFKIGFYFSPEEHVWEAMRLEHPASMCNLVPDGLRRNIFLFCTEKVHAMARRRISNLQHILDVKKSLESDEAKLRLTLPEHVNEVAAGKPICLFWRLLEETGFPDMEVCNTMEKGIPLTGVEPDSPRYCKKHRAAQMTPEQLDYQACWRRRAMVGMLMTDDENVQEADMETETLSEVDAGFLQGPFSAEEISAIVGDEAWSLSKRFVLYQWDERKIRVIDDYRDSGVNSAYASSSYLALQDTDFVISCGWLATQIKF